MAAIKTRTIVQILLIVAIVAAGVRLAFILNERSQNVPMAQQARANAPPLNPEAYVVPKKLYLSTLKSTQQLVGKTVWVKEGYRYTVYPFNRGTVDFQHAAGLLSPIQRLVITKIATAPTPGARERQILAVFEEDGKAYAVPIGVESGRDVTIYADEMFFYEDPHSLYSFWAPEIWQAIDHHQVQKGMNEIEVAFAIGMGIPEPGESEAQKTIRYPNGGKPLVITYSNGRAVDIKPGSPS